MCVGTAMYFAKCLIRGGSISPRNIGHWRLVQEAPCFLAAQGVSLPALGRESLFLLYQLLSLEAIWFLERKSMVQPGLSQRAADWQGAVGEYLAKQGRANSTLSWSTVVQWLLNMGLGNLRNSTASVSKTPL